MLYIVSEFLDGPDLNQWTKANSPSLEQTLSIVAGIADALAYAHSQRTVHRDLKPGNIILTEQADGVRPVLVDFGLALSEASENSLGQIGMIAGTPNYMAPEQARGFGHRIDGRTDIYALGITLYRMLCGKLPFTGTDIHVLLQRIISEEATPPRQINREIPASVEKLCLKAMAKEISDRHTTAGDFAVELRAELKLVKATSTQAGQEKPVHRAGHQEAIRRQVSVLNCGCDLFESEEFLENVDPEEQHEVLRKYDDLCRRTVAQFDGRIIQSTGTEVLVCFGYPTAYEDAAERAVRTGLALIAQAPLLKETLGNVEIEYDIWAGVHTGQAILQETEGGLLSMMGDARNIAARLENVSEDNAVVLTETTHRLVSDLFECESHGKLKVKGASRKVGIFLVNGESESRHRLDAKSNVALTRIVGRETELALLVEAWESAQEDAGQLICILGEAGLGKSRLVREVKEYAQRSSVGDSSIDDSVGSGAAVVVEWRCSPFFSNTGLYPAIDFLTRTLSFSSEGSPAARLDALVGYLEKLQIADSRTVTLFADLLGVPTNDRYPSLGLSPGRQKAETLDALSRWLEASSAQAPILFIVEDLHWMDATTLEWIGRLANSCDELSALCVLTFRPDFETPWGSRGNQSQIALNRLTQVEIGEMMKERLGIADVPRKVVTRIVERTEGVPLFIEEFCLTLMESGALQEHDGEIQLSSDFDMSGIPSSLQDLLVARLDRLDSQHDLVFVGATIGREFTFQMMRSVTELDDATLHDELDKLVHAEIAFREGTPPEAIYTFKHALIQDAAYTSMLKKRRQENHLRIAEVFETDFPDVVDSQPELLAHHFTQAGDVARAIDYWLKAGQRSQGRSANHEAIEHYRNGLKVIESLVESTDRDQQENSFQLALVGALVGAKGYGSPEVSVTLERTRELSERLGEPTTLMIVLWFTWAMSLIRSELDQSVDDYAEMLALAERTGDDGLLMEALFGQICTCFFRGEFEPVPALSERGIALYDEERCRMLAQFIGQNAGVTIRNFWSCSLWHLGSVDQALSVASDAVQVSRDIEHPFSQVHGMTEAAWVNYFCRRGDETLALGVEALSISQKHDFPFWEACAMATVGGGLILNGKYEDGIAQVRTAFTLFRSTGGAVHQCFMYSVLAEGLRGANRREEALSEIENALTAAVETRELYMHAELLRQKGQLLLELSELNVEAAEQCFVESLEVANHQSALSCELRTLMDLAQLRQSQGRISEAREMLRATYNKFTEGFSTPDLIRAEALLEELDRPE